MSLSKVKVFTPPLQLIGLVFIFIYALFGIQFFSERSEVLLSVYFQESWANVRSAYSCHTPDTNGTRFGLSVHHCSHQFKICTNEPMIEVLS